MRIRQNTLPDPDASRPEPLLEVVYWNLFFIAMNLVLIGRILRQRRIAAAEKGSDDESSEMRG